VFVKAELLENSAVPVPANPEAVVIKGLGGKTLQVDGPLLRSMLEAGWARRSEEEPQAQAEAPAEAPAATQEPASAPAEPPPAAPEAPAEPAPAEPKAFTEALTALLGMAKSLRREQVVSDEAARSLLIQTTNLFRELLKAPEEPVQDEGELTEEEALAMAKDLAALADRIKAQGSPEDIAAASKLAAEVEKVLSKRAPISGA
jgi:hypothetical protein